MVDNVLARLQDDGTIYSRDEIMRWLSEAYRSLTYRGKHVRTFTAFDMPPRHANAITYDWEKNVVKGTWRKWTFSHGLSEHTYLWEIQQLGGMEPEPSSRAVTHLWEMSQGEGEV